MRGRLVVVIPLVAIAFPRWEQAIRTDLRAGMVKKQSLAAGVIASVVVPYGPSGEMDADQLRSEVEQLEESGVDGLCVGGLLSGRRRRSSR